MCPPLIDNSWYGKIDLSQGYLIRIAFVGLIRVDPLVYHPGDERRDAFYSVLVYRFAFACLLIFFILLKQRRSLRINFGEGIRLVVLAILYDSSALFLFWGYNYMSSGVATTIHFMYPVLTALIMALFFREKVSISTFLAIGLAIVGVVLLTLKRETESAISIEGLVIVLISALAYALYLIMVNQFKVRRMGSLKLTFYVFLFGTFFLWINAEIVGEVEPITSWSTAGNLIMLALIPTVLSNISLIQAVKRIGSTLTSVMGAMEPLTAVFVGILLLNEPFSSLTALGIMSIVAAVILLVLRKKA